MLWKIFSLIKVWPRRESWFIKSVDIMENCHCHQGGEGETRGILRTKWSRRWDLHFSWLQLAEKPQPHSLANASEERHFSSYQFISTISRLFYCPQAVWQLTTNLDQTFAESFWFYDSWWGRAVWARRKWVINTHLLAGQWSFFELNTTRNPWN